MAHCCSSARSSADYWPFGKSMDYGMTYAASTQNHYGFGEKEKQPKTGYLDFHAR